MTTDSKKRPVLFWVIFSILIFECISAVPYGFMLAFDPTGGLANMQVEILKGTIFNNYRIPGLILLIVLGLGSFFMAMVLLHLPDWKWAKYLNPFKKQNWTWTAAIGLGLIIMIWITVQVIMIGFDSLLQPLHFCIGLSLVILPLIPSIRRYLSSH